MTARVENIQSYAFKSGDRLFFDTNIWFFINGPQADSSERQQRIYSQAYKEIISRGICIYIDVNVLSEFINRWARFAYNLWTEENGFVEFKQYRQLEEFKKVAEEISESVDQILIDCSVVTVRYEKAALNDFVDLFRTGAYDFNDPLLHHVCQKCGCTLVTDDADFIRSDIHILTANRSLLS